MSFLNIGKKIIEKEVKAISKIKTLKGKKKAIKKDVKKTEKIIHAIK